MRRLTTRLERLEQRRVRPASCPGHATEALHGGYRAALAPFLPPDMAADLPELEAPAPCERCGGRREFAFDVVARDDRGAHGPE